MLVSALPHIWPSREPRKCKRRISPYKPKRNPVHCRIWFTSDTPSGSTSASSVGVRDRFNILWRLHGALAFQCCPLPILVHRSHQGNNYHLNSNLWLLTMRNHQATHDPLCALRTTSGDPSREGDGLTIEMELEGNGPVESAASRAIKDKH